MDKKAKILLVDDDPDFVSAIRTILESQRYEVITADEGEAGLKTARKEKPDLIILDVIMPVKDGFTAAEQLKKDPALAKIPVIMLTSFARKGQETAIPRSRGFDLDTDDYLDKPVSPAELLKAVARYV